MRLLKKKYEYDVSVLVDGDHEFDCFGIETCWFFRSKESVKKGIANEFIDDMSDFGEISVQFSYFERT